MAFGMTPGAEGPVTSRHLHLQPWPVNPCSHGGLPGALGRFSASTWRWRPRLVPRHAVEAVCAHRRGPSRPLRQGEILMAAQLFKSSIDYGQVRVHNEEFLPFDLQPDNTAMTPNGEIYFNRFAERWFAERGWQPFDFQRQVWAAMAAGRGGLLHATTGAGKTYAVALGALARAAALGVSSTGKAAPPLGILWITPMRALAADSQRALAAPLADLAPAWTLGLRSGDTPSAERARQDRRLPTVLVSTPESLTLLLTKADAAERLAGVHTVVVDEWHELVGNKRGVQVQLLLARLATWNPRLLVWGLSATLGNLPDALAMLQGPQPPGDAPPVLVQGRIDKALVIDTLLPPNPGRFSWGGHLGAQMQQPVADEIARTVDAGGGTTLVFTNVRSQAEAWYQMLLAARPDWAGEIALHHGSLDKSGARMGGSRAEGRHAEGGGGHLVAGPGGGLPAGVAGAADRLGQGRGAAAAARRPLGPPARPAQPHHPGAHQHAGTGGGGGRAPRRGRGPGGATPCARRAAGRAGAAPGQHRAGRRLHRRRVVCRGALRPQLPRAVG
jgi:hypothetical protein